MGGHQPIHMAFCRYCQISITTIWSMLNRDCLHMKYINPSPFIWKVIDFGFGPDPLCDANAPPTFVGWGGLWRTWCRSLNSSRWIPMWTTRNAIGHHWASHWKLWYINIRINILPFRRLCLRIGWAPKWAGESCFSWPYSVGSMPHFQAQISAW